MEKQVRAYCERWEMLPVGGRVLCAVSGGRDSMALLHLLRVMARRDGFALAAAHFNHGLRPTAKRDEDFVRAWCQQQGIPCYTGSGEMIAKEGNGSLEDAARQSRYAFLEEIARTVGAERIATAHHRQDNAETLLLNLLRGTGLQGLTGIPPVRGRIIRPLLDIDRRDIDRYVRENDIPYMEDETNADPAYARRNRLRLEALPLLEEIAPGCVERMARTAALLREEDLHLRQEVERLLPPCEQDGSASIPVSLLVEQDAAMAHRVVRAMAERLGKKLTAAQTEAALRLESGSCLDLGGGLQAVRKPHRLILRRKRELPPPCQLALGRQSWGDYEVEVTAAATDTMGKTAVLRAGVLEGCLSIGAWDGTGRLAVKNGGRTVKRLFADRGISVEEREEYPALYLDGKLIAVPGVAVDRAFQPEEGEAVVTVRVGRTADQKRLS